MRKICHFGYSDNLCIILRTNAKKAEHAVSLYIHDGGLLIYGRHRDISVYANLLMD